jgi:hypothetical protein
MANDKHKELQSRIAYVKGELERALQILNADSPLPIWLASKDKLGKIDSNRVHDLWEKALARVDVDPDGAVTAAKSFLEAIFKYILMHSGIDVSDNDDLPKLYSQTAEQLQLLPSQWDPQLFKQILGNARGVVTGLAELRNKYGDSHANPRATTIKPRHARLAVNMAGSIATFFVETWEARLEYNGEPLPRWFHDDANLQLAMDILAEDQYAQEETDRILGK